MSLKAYIDLNHGFSIEKNTLSGGAFASPLINGLLAYWNLNNNGSGGVSLVDSSGNGRTLTNNNGVALGDGIIAGGGIFAGDYFSANYQWLTSNPFPVLSGDFTLSVWLNKDAIFTDYYQTFISTRPDGAATDNSFSMGFDPSSVPIYYDGTSTFFESYLTPNSWANFVIMNASGLISIYLNGFLQVSFAQTYPYANSYLSIGGNQNGDEPFGGKIDEVGIWNRSLSENEILALYNTGSGLTYPFMN